MQAKKSNFYLYIFYGDIGRESAQQERQSEALPSRYRKFDQ